MTNTTPAQRDEHTRPPTWQLVVGLTTTLLVVAALGLAASPIGQRWFEAAEAAEPVTGVTRVGIEDSRFLPASISVPAGTTVSFDWTDGEEHDLVFADGPRWPVRASGEVSRTFETPGEYAYVCTLHLFMDGRVVVTE